MKTTEQIINGIRVVELSPEEEAQYESLRLQKDAKERESWQAAEAARQAVVKRNRIRRELRNIQAKWLVLAERKFPR